MDTKKTIFISVATTLVTMFVVAVMLHICRGNCHRGNSCSANVECSSKSSCSQSSSCASYSHCSSKKKCDKSSSCSGKSKCSKGKSCSSKTTCSKGKNGEKIIKKEVIVDVEE